MRTEIRDAVEDDAAQFLALRSQLFAETSFMLWDPAEFNATIADERQYIRRLSNRSNSRLLVAALESTLVGFIAAIGGEHNRQRHSALLALGVARDFWSKGIGSRMLGEIVAWAPSTNLKRLELTVHTANDRAIALYRRHGFEVEGTRRCSLWSTVNTSMSILCPSLRESNRPNLEDAFSITGSDYVRSTLP